MGALQTKACLQSQAREPEFGRVAPDRYVYDMIESWEQSRSIIQLAAWRHARMAMRRRHTAILLDVVVALALAPSFLITHPGNEATQRNT